MKIAKSKRSTEMKNEMNDSKKKCDVRWHEASHKSKYLILSVYHAGATYCKGGIDE